MREITWAGTREDGERLILSGSADALKQQRSTLRWSLLLAASLVVLGGLDLLNPTDDPSSPWILCIGGIAGMLLLLLALLRKRPKALGDLVAKAVEGMDGREHRVELTEEGIEFRDETLAMAIPWSAVVDCDSGEGFSRWKTGSGTSVQVPDRAFAAETDRDAFVAEAARLWAAGSAT